MACQAHGPPDGDGARDILTTAPGASYGAVGNGRAYLFHGGEDLVDAWGVAADVILDGRFRDYERFGVAVGSIDLAGDGVMDLSVGALGADLKAPGAGSVHIFHGGDELVDAGAGSDALTLEGEEALSRFGASISSGE